MMTEEDVDDMDKIADGVLQRYVSVPAYFIGFAFSITLLYLVGILCEGR